MPIVVRIDVELARRKMSVGEFAERVGLTPANVAVLKNGRAKAVRFSTLDAMCRSARVPTRGPSRVGAGGGNPMKNVTLALLVVAGIAIGIAGVIAGGIDDSPGAQLLSVSVRDRDRRAGRASTSTAPGRLRSRLVGGGPVSLLIGPVARPD